LVISTLTVGLALSQVWRDETPPELVVEVGERVPAGRPFIVRLATDEPVLYVLRYSDLVYERATRDLEVSLLAEEGAHQLVITAVDTSGNESQYRAGVVGVAPLKPELDLPEEVTAGDPIALKAVWPLGGASVRQMEARLGGTSLPLIPYEWGVTAFGVVPLGSEADSLPLIFRLTDEFGRVIELERLISVTPDTRAVEELNLSEEILKARTPEGFELEQQVLERVFEAGQAEMMWQDPFIPPIEGVATSGFGSPRRYVRGGAVSHHQGTDIAAPEGTPIRAVNDGIVKVAGFYPIKGGLVVVDHGAEVSSLYFHQSSLDVEEGDRVRRGDVIGRVGSTGVSTGPHLHWEVRIGGLATDPHAWVGKVLP
jgi:hypothetical protein